MPTELDRLTSISPLLGSLAPATLLAVVEAGRVVRRDRGRVVLAEAEDAAAVVLHGTASTRVAASDGSEYLRGLHAVGEVVGLAVVLGARSDLQVLLAQDPVVALRLPGPAVRGLLHQHPDMARACLRVLVDEVAHSHRDEAGLAGTSTTERITLRLVELADRWGEPDGDGIRIEVPLTQEELASWARTSRESTAKVLHLLREAGLVTTGRRRLVVQDLTALRRRSIIGGPDPTLHDVLGSLG